MHTLWLLIAASLTIGWGIAGAASAEGSDEAVQVAITAANAGRCDEAERALEGRNQLESRARLLVGQCRIRAGLYPEALLDFDRIRGASDLTPSQVGDVELYRGVAFYHLERYTEATAALGRADGLTSEEAQLSLYRGLIALRNGDSDRAAPALETAARLSPAVTEPVASYYAGLAWEGSAERVKARRAFKRVVDIDGDGPWGKEAAKMLDAMAPYPFYVNMSAGIEYDDNVQLRGGVTRDAVGVNTNGEKDFRGVWRIDGGVQLFEIDDWSGGINGGYAGNAHDGLADFNTNYLTGGAYLTHRLDPNSFVRAQYQYGFAWVDEESFLSTQVAEVGYSHVWPMSGTTDLVAGVLWTDLRFDFEDVPDAGFCPALPTPLTIGCGPTGLREDQERNRDSVAYSAGLSHSYPVVMPASIDSVFQEMNLLGGYHFRYIDSKGNEWEHYSHLFRVGVLIELPRDFRVSTHATYEYRDFANPSTYPDLESPDIAYALSGADREEHEVTFQAEVEKDLTEQLSISARWTYLNNESNRRVYDYTRHVVGGYVNVRFE